MLKLASLLQNPEYGKGERTFSNSKTAWAQACKPGCMLVREVVDAFDQVTQIPSFYNIQVDGFKQKIELD